MTLPKYCIGALGHLGPYCLLSRAARVLQGHGPVTLPSIGPLVVSDSHQGALRAWGLAKTSLASLWSVKPGKSPPPLGLVDCPTFLSGWEADGGTGRGGGGERKVCDLLGLATAQGPGLDLPSSAYHWGRRVNTFRPALPCLALPCRAPSHPSRECSRNPHPDTRPARHGIRAPTHPHAFDILPCDKSAPSLVLALCCCCCCSAPPWGKARPSSAAEHKGPAAVPP